MGEVRIISTIKRDNVKSGNELPKPLALVVVQWIGFIWAGFGFLRLIWVSFAPPLCALFGVGDYTKIDVGAFLFESVLWLIAEALFLFPFLAMCFGMKWSRYLIPILCTFGAGIACSYMSIPLIISIMGFVPPVAIWVCPSIRRWYDSLV